MSDLGTCWESGCGREGLEMMVWWRVASIDWFVWELKGVGKMAMWFLGGSVEGG